MKYRICPDCGSSLNPQKSCDCLEVLRQYHLAYPDAEERYNNGSPEYRRCMLWLTQRLPKMLDLIIEFLESEMAAQSKAIDGQKTAPGVGAPEAAAHKIPRRLNRESL